MIKKNITSFFCMVFFSASFAQKNTDTIIIIGNKSITLSEVVVNNKLNVPVFINRIKNDTSFYKAFRNLHMLGFTVINDIRMNDADGKIKAGLHSTTKQIRSKNCRTMQTLQEQVTGDIYDEKRNFNYYTAKMYGSLFFTKDSICDEDKDRKSVV